MLNKTVLCRFIIVGSDEKQTVCAELLCFLGHHDRVCCVVGSGSGNDRDSALHNINRELNDLKMFRVIECRSLAGSAACDDRVCVICDLVLKKSLICVIVYFTVLFHGSYDSNS